MTTLADRHALIRRCLFEPLEDRRLLATFSAAGGEIADNETTTFSLEVSASELIGDLNVSVNISHLDVQDLDVYLLGPAGSPRVELFTDVGGSGVISRGPRWMMKPRYRLLPVRRHSAVHFSRKVH